MLRPSPAAALSMSVIVLLFLLTFAAAARDKLGSDEGFDASDDMEILLEPDDADMEEVHNRLTFCLANLFRSHHFFR